MKWFYLIAVAVFMIGCAPIQKGDYVTYTSQEYVFIENNFIDKSVDCVELGEMKQGGLSIKYCIGKNYASEPVQGFIFEHDYTSFNERFVGSTLSFKAKQIIVLQCSSETKNDAPAGKEYINCMVPKRSFDLHSFIVNTKTDILGTFRAAVGEQKIYSGVIDPEAKALLKQFYKDYQDRHKRHWKKRNL